MKNAWGFLIISSFIFSGCFWPFSGGKSHVIPALAGSGISVEVLDTAPLTAGARVSFMPFSAGADAEAGEALDHVSLMILKGFSDGLSQEGRFTLVSGNDAAGADIVVRGHIEEFKTLGHFSKTTLITVRGDARVSKNENVTAVIYARQKVAAVAGKVDQAAYDIGSAIAQKLSE